MKRSLQARVSVFIALIIIVLSAFSTSLFIATYHGSAEKELTARGSALCYTLSKASEEGFAGENLNLIKKASYVIEAPDVTLVQVYSSIWQAVDAYPFDRLREPPNPGAVEHFKERSSPVHFEMGEGYDFYQPIMYKVHEDLSPLVIGYVRVALSSAAYRKNIREIIALNITLTLIVTALAVIALNLLVRRLVIKPVMALHHSVSRFRNGIVPDGSSAPPSSASELRELSEEFTNMCLTVREKENRLTESEGRIRTLFERVEHAVFRLDRAGSIIEANSRFRDLFGPVTDLCEILIGERSAPECLAKAAAESALHLEEMALGKDGSELMVSLSLYPETGADGAIAGFDGYLLDITEKRRLQERLMRAQKLEAVGTLAGGMAHDFNNLLTAILGYAGIILKTTKEGDPYYKPASIIYDAAKRGAEFGKKILTITRKERIETRPVNINDIVRSSLELLQRSMPKDIEIVTGLAEEVPLTSADPSQMQQVIINLAVNARDAMPAGGKLVIETSTVSPGNGRAAAEAGGFIKLSVADTGMGIDTETQAKIFDPFFTTKESGKGTGLGLYIVHSIVNNHGGYINLYSEPGRGTRFNIYLPVTKSVDTSALPEPEDIAGSGTILVIDDESHVRELCKDVLSSIGYTVLLAESGSSGVGIYRERKDEISLVILDMVMPKMGGSEVFHALRTINPRTRILLYSGYSHNNFAGINDLLKRGAVGFIQKPFSNQEIGIAVKKALSQQP